MVKDKQSYGLLLILLTLIFLFNALDYLATKDLVVYGEHGELNPLMDGLLGTPYFSIYKLVLIPLGLIFLWVCRGVLIPKYLKLVWLTCGIYGLLMIYTWTVFYS